MQASSTANMVAFENDAWKLRANVTSVAVDVFDICCLPAQLPQQSDPNSETSTVLGSLGTRVAEAKMGGGR